MNSWVVQHSFRTFWNLDPSSEVICIWAGCANGKMEPRGSKNHSRLPVPIAARDISQPLRTKSVVYCDWVLIWHKFICYCWGRQFSLSHLCHLSNISPIGHLSRFKPRISLLCSSPLLLFLSLFLPGNSSAPSLANSPGLHHFSTI